MEIDDNKNPNPKKDQHFMIDQNMLLQIYEKAGIQPGESIVEIGGGEGALTDYLVQGHNFVTVIEKDPYYAELLKRKYSGYSNVIVLEGDALMFDLGGYDRIVANLPYTITEPFLINLASSGALDYNINSNKGSNLKSITLVLSQNSLRKMVAPIQISDGKYRHENKEFGLMGAICKAFCDVEIVCAIPSSSFFPEPAVTSFLVNLTSKKEKTTVDRIVRELLTDKKGTRPTIKRIYQTLLAQEKIYKISKHKKIMNDVFPVSFSPAIEIKNIYDLSNGQISQLFQDLIKNDMRIKSRDNQKRRIDYFEYEDSMDFDNPDDLSEDDEDFSEDGEDFFKSEMRKATKVSKFLKKYEYMYENKRYLALLNRGLEYINPDELQIMLGNSIQSSSQMKLI